MMLTPEEITKEVKEVFGDDARVDIKFSPNLDGYFIEVHKRVRNEMFMVSAAIPAIEELQDGPLAVLRSYLGYMYYYYMQALEEDSKDANLRLPRPSGKDKGNGGDGGPTYH